jgi:hypothetical protein
MYFEEKMCYLVDEIFGLRKNECGYVPSMSLQAAYFWTVRISVKFPVRFT